MMYTLKEGLDFDHRLLFNAVAAQDTISVVRALRPLIGLYDTLCMKTIGSPYEGIEQDCAQAQEYEETIKATLNALDINIRAAVAANLNRHKYFITAELQDYLDEAEQASTGVAIQLVNDEEFNARLAVMRRSTSSAGDIRELKMELLGAVDDVADAEKFDAYMIAAFQFEDLQIRERALSKALEVASHVPVIEVDGFDAEEARFYTAYEVYLAGEVEAESHGDSRQMMEDSRKARPAARREEPVMDRATYLYQLSHLKPA